MARRNRDSRPESALNIDHTLVSALENVEHAAGVYLAELSQANLENLREMVALLDDQAAASDQWAQRVASAGIWGYADIHSAIGQSATNPVIDQEESSLFNLQVALVQAAKGVLRLPDPNSVETLRTAFAAVKERTA